MRTVLFPLSYVLTLLIPYKCFDSSENCRCLRVNLTLIQPRRDCLLICALYIPHDADCFWVFFDNLVSFQKNTLLNQFWFPPKPRCRPIVDVVSEKCDGCRDGRRETDWWASKRQEEHVFLLHFSPHSSCLFLCLVTYHKALHLEQNQGFPDSGCQTSQNKITVERYLVKQCFL